MSRSFLKKIQRLFCLSHDKLSKEDLRKSLKNQPFLLNYSYVGHIVFTIIQSSGRHEEEFDPRDIAILSTICKIRDKIALFFANQMFPRGFIEILAPQAKL